MFYTLKGILPAKSFYYNGINDTPSESRNSYIPQPLVHLSECYANLEHDHLGSKPVTSSQRVISVKHRYRLRTMNEKT